MPPASVPTLCTFPAASTAPDPEFARVLRIADPGPALDGPLTFAPPAAGPAEAWLEQWRAWRDGPWTTVLGPAALAATAHAARGQAREIQEASLRVHAALEPQASLRSAQTGARLLQRLGTSRGERWLARLRQWAAEPGCPVHFAVLYGAQSALFHLPLRLLLPGYAYWEWTAALDARPPAGPRLPEFGDELAGLCGAAASILSSRENHAEHSPAVFGGA